MVKYPLSPEDKELATRLVEAWDSGILDRSFSIIEFRGGDRINGAVVADGSAFKTPPLSAYEPLAEYKLLTKDGSSILLLQELRNAVNNDFELTEYAIATQTGLLVANEIKELSEQLRQVLGEDLLASNQSIAHAIQELSQVSEADKVSKAGNLIGQLGNSLGHINNTGGALQAILFLVKFLSQ